jgi:hypothetical protein
MLSSKESDQVVEALNQKEKLSRSSFFDLPLAHYLA